MRRKDFDSTLSIKTVEEYSMHGRIMPLYIVNCWRGEKSCRRRRRTPNFIEAVLIRNEMRGFQFRL
ncbi:hypothetical protein E2C01_066482 [Portunus trituberculatus]|uniref:Uncharacterized protein n=1 Tax=Portunus trituberculatus TaxID=210409 RepID=A0A5B7HR50_PORTR|nr:hypothetical protein [Portunus trituberculatus]